MSEELETIIGEQSRQAELCRPQVFTRFYANPPRECGWPWILRNIREKGQPQAKHEIIDIGIYDLMDPPHRHSKEKLKKWEALEPRGWRVVPDCPDLQGEFNKKVSFDSVEYTWELLNQYYNPEDPSHLPVIQSKYKDLQSFQESINRFKREYGTPQKIGIGSIYKADNNTIAVNMLKIARREFPESWIHAFGLRRRAFRRAYKFINSYDSTSWTFPPGQGRGSCKNKAERIEFFWHYVNSIKYPHHHPTQEVLKCL